MAKKRKKKSEFVKERKVYNIPYHPRRKLGFCFQNPPILVFPRCDLEGTEDTCDANPQLTLSHKSSGTNPSTIAKSDIDGIHQGRIVGEESVGIEFLRIGIYGGIVEDGPTER